MGTRGMPRFAVFMRGVARRRAWRNMFFISLGGRRTVLRIGSARASVLVWRLKGGTNRSKCCVCGSSCLRRQLFSGSCVQAITSRARRSSSAGERRCALAFCKALEKS